MADHAARYRRIEACRIGGGNNLVSVLSLGEQTLTGVFPKSRDAQVTKGPLAAALISKN